MSLDWTRRQLLTAAAAGLAVPAAQVLARAPVSQRAPLFPISLAQWSWPRELGAKTLDHQGKVLPEREGILRTKQLLERVRDEFSRARMGGPA